MIYATCLIIMVILSQMTIIFPDFPENIWVALLVVYDFCGSMILQSGLYSQGALIVIITVVLFIQGKFHDLFSPGNGKQELYTGAGVYVSCVELHHIHDRAGFNPADIITSMMSLLFTEEELATSVPFRENGSKTKGKVLQQQILHSIIGKNNL